jgi:hypothetical protein
MSSATWRRVGRPIPDSRRDGAAAPRLSGGSEAERRRRATNLPPQRATAVTRSSARKAFALALSAVAAVRGSTLWRWGHIRLSGRALRNGAVIALQIKSGFNLTRQPGPEFWREFWRQIILPVETRSPESILGYAMPQTVFARCSVYLTALQAKKGAFAIFFIRQYFVVNMFLRVSWLICFHGR